MAEILVIGVGNEFRGDDAVGIWVARQLAQSAPPRVAVIEQRGEGADLMDAWQGAEMVLLIDAASSGAKPGTIHRFAAHQAPLPAELFSFSSHAFGVAEAVEMARLLGELPPQMLVYTIEGETFDPGASLSPAVAQAVEDIIPRLLREIESQFSR
jgi:hydrogenase maturation protease